MSFSAGGRDHMNGNPGSSGAGDGAGSHVDNLKHYFGEVHPQYQKMLAEDKFAHETYNLPKAYEGKNKYLERVIDYLVTNENDWYCGEVLPWVETDDLNINWDIFRFNKTLMDLEPHQGVPRYVTAEREARTDRLVRRGLAFIIEHGFYTTAEGRQHYLMNLRQIVDSVTETASHGVVYALLSADNHYKEWHRQHGTRVSRPGDLQRQQKRLWGIVQKKERGLYLLDAELKDVMRYEGVRPDTWIVPSKMSIYVTMVNGANAIDYYKGGPETQGALEKGPAAFQTFRGSKVFESRPFDIDFIGEPYDLLVRRRQIGEHFVLGSHPCGRNNAGEVENLSASKSKFDAFLYSMDTDNFERVSFEESAVAACNTIAQMDADDRLKVKKVLLAGCKSGAGKTALSGLLDGLGASNPNVKELVSASFGDFSNGGRPLFRVLLLRPFETYDMASAILMKRGLETGMTAHGHHDFMLSDDVIHKIHIGHYTMYHKSIVKQPKNITIAEDIFARNYVGGEGTSMYKSASDFRDDSRNDTFGRDMVAMLIPAEDMLDDSVSESELVECGCNPQKGGQVTNPLDIAGAYEGNILDEVPTDLSDKSDGLYPLSAIYDKYFGFRNIKTYDQDQAQFLSPLRHNNTVTWQGMQLEYRNSSEGGKFDRVTLATGHWGPNCYAGCKSVRTGENAFLKDMEYEKIRTAQGVIQ